MKKKIVTVTITILLILCATLYSFATSNTDLQQQQSQIQSEIENKKDEIDDKEVQKNEALSEINELSTKITESQRKLDELYEQIKELEKKIEESEKQLVIAEKKYNQQKEALEKRVVAQYKSGKTTYLDMLLNSTSLSSFISNYYLAGKIAKADNQLLESIETEKQRIEAQKQELEQQRVEVKTKKAEAEKENVILKNAKAQKNSQVAKLSQEQQTLQQQIDEYDRRMEDLRRQIQAQQAANGGGSNVNYNGQMQWPVPSSGKITSGFEMRIHPIYKIPKMHNGIDIGGAAYGAPFVAADDGIVIQASDKGNGYGNCVIIDHGGGVSTLYAHGSAIYVTVGQHVTRGQEVLAIGSSGLSTGKHAHFEVRINGTPVNPVSYVT